MASAGWLMRRLGSGGGGVGGFGTWSSSGLMLTRWASWSRGAAPAEELAGEGMRLLGLRWGRRLGSNVHVHAVGGASGRVIHGVNRSASSSSSAFMSSSKVLKQPTRTMMTMRMGSPSLLGSNHQVTTTASSPLRKASFEAEEEGTTSWKLYLRVTGQGRFMRVHTYSFVETEGQDPIRLIHNTPPMKRATALYLVLVFSLLIYCCVCIDRTPVSGRLHIVLLPMGVEHALSDVFFNASVAEPLIKGREAAPERIKRLMDALEKVCLSHTGHLITANGFEGFWDWILYVSADPEPNAITMPGGRIVVNVGLLNLLMENGHINEAELAAVLAHELGHSLARHSMHTFSKMVPLNALLVLFSSFLSNVTGAGRKDSQKANMKEEEGSLSNAFLELVFFLPTSRQHEYEADYIGLMLMANAGYDPNAAISIQKKLMALSQDNSTLAKFTGTHPIGPDRIEALQSALPEAERLYKNTKSRPPQSQPQASSSSSTQSKKGWFW